VHGDAPTEVAALKERPGKDVLVWGSLSLVHSLFEARLVDEIQLRVCPVTIGNGLNLFPGHLDLELTEAKPYASGIISAHYRPKQ
jgi:dihydrofolate reductase